jgi:ribosomal protein S18 acetylase RimI-like enzyme
MKVYLFSGKSYRMTTDETATGNGSFKKIKQGKTEIGKIGLERHGDIRALGIGSFEINKDQRRKGHAERFLKQLIKKNKKKNDLIYCYVNEDNAPAIGLYNKIGKVGDKIVNHEPGTGKGQYMV